MEINYSRCCIIFQIRPVLLTNFKRISRYRLNIFCSLPIKMKGIPHLTNYWFIKSVMANPQHIQQHTDNQHLEKRAFKRYPILLKAFIQPEGSSSGCHCTIRNFCVGGFYVTLDEQRGTQAGAECHYTPKPNDIARIQCLVPGTENNKPLIIQCRIVHPVKNSAGLSFINPDLEVLLFLQKLTEEYRETHRQRSDNKTATEVAQPVPQQTPGEKDQDLIERCNNIFKGHLLRLLNLFLNDINEHLFNSAKEERDAKKQNAYFDARDKLSINQDKLRNSFEDAVSESLNNYTPEKDLHASPAIDTPSDGEITLSLMEEDVFDEWLADTVAVDNIDTHYRRQLLDLDKRLSVIWAADIHKENNLYGPYLISHTFQETIKKLQLGHVTNVLCYKFFENVLMKELGGLYDELNQKLIDNNILPTIQYSVNVANQASEKPESKVQSTQDNAPLQQDDRVPGSPVEDAKLEENQNALLKKSSAQSADALDEDSLRLAKELGSVQDLYQLVGDLKNLQQQLSSQVGATNNSGMSPGPATLLPSGQDNTSVSQNSLVPYSPDDVLKVLSKLQPPVDQPISLDESPDEFKARVVEMLAANDQSGETKNIGARESQIIDVAGHVFHSLMADMQLADKVRMWIKRLELPVLKIAMLDDSIFLDREHYVRQVVNKIADLEILAQDGDAAQQVLVKRALDWLVNLINTEFDESAEVFSRAEKQLDLLLNVQNRNYEDNIQQVIETSKREEQALLDAGAAAPREEPEHVDAPDEDWREWEKKARRLKEGAWMVFDVHAEKPRRLRLAWIAANTERYIFVNVMGKRERIVKLYDLVSEMHDGTAIVLDNADEPAMDRAQYNMLEQLHQKLYHQTIHDQLTGLINRREFEKELGKALTHSRCTDAKHALFFIDIDQFQVLNNTCGYEGGDKLLVEVAELINSQLEHKSVLARLGSDEFGLLLYDCSLEDALDIAEQKIQAASEHRFIWNDKPISISISLGMVPVTRSWENTSSLLQAAESSCGIAKDIGGGRMQLYHTGHAKLSHRNKLIKWISEIDSALEQDLLQLRCQKIMPVQQIENAKNHYEILLTLRDEEGKEISVQEFIEAGEWYNRAAEIDRWVIEHSLNWMADHPTILNDLEGFSINLSGRSLQDLTLIDFIDDQIRMTGVPAEKICFEITETAGIANLSDAAEFIECVKETGCKFSLDDFGSGMSSYAYLKNLPIDYLKIDGAFVRDILENNNDMAVVKSISEIGHFMGKKIVAECVEDEATLFKIRELGVDYAQGYAIEKPILIDELY